jgi:prostaglandin-H2 D-isomerase / glutathione transferase
VLTEFKKTPMHIRLKYFPIAGAAEPVRLALWLAQIPFDDVAVPFDAWWSLKQRTPYGQLPVMSIDGGPYIAQSSAMLQYIGTLAPTLCPADKFLQVQEAIGLVGDFDRAWRPCIGLVLEPEVSGYGLTPATAAFTKGSPALAETIKALRIAFVANQLPKYCAFFAKMIASSGGPFLCGAQPTLADCCLVPALDRFAQGYIDHVPQDTLAAYPAITSYLADFKALPQIQAYTKSKAAAE